MKFELLTSRIPMLNKTDYITRMWITVYPILKTKYVLLNKLGKVSSVTGRKYTGDLEGLLRNELSIGNDYVLPTLLVNGYLNSQDYDGRQTEFLLVDDRMLNRFLMSFKRTEKKLSEV